MPSAPARTSKAWNFPPPSEPLTFVILTFSYSLTAGYAVFSHHLPPAISPEATELLLTGFLNTVTRSVVASKESVFALSALWANAFAGAAHTLDMVTVWPSTLRACASDSPVWVAMRDAVWYFSLFARYFCNSSAMISIPPY